MRIMIDECVTQGPANALIQFFAIEHPPIEAHFVVGYFGQQGLKDHQIADVLHQEGGWFVITADRGRRSRSSRKRMVHGPPMQEILPAKGITAVYLGSSLQEAPGAEKVRAIVTRWPEIKQFFEASPPEERRLLTKRGEAFALLSY